MSTLQTVTRTFCYSGVTLPDPDPALTPDQVREFYTALYPEMVNACVEGGDFEGAVQQFTIRRGTGTKG